MTGSPRLRALRDTFVSFVALVLVPFVAFVTIAAAQQGDPLSGTGVISGRVVEGRSTRPIAGATVTLIVLTSSGPLGPAPIVTADAQGRFVFSGVPDGEFRVHAARQGWQPGTYGLDRPLDDRSLGGVIRLPSGGRADVTVPVWRNAVVSGRVTDEAGEPIAGAFVSARRWLTIAGRRQLGGSGWVTDDRGFYTLSLPPGEYIIEATSADVRARSGGSAAAPAQRFVFERTFYPGTSMLPAASVLTLDSGVERSGVDIRLPLRRGIRVAGVLRNTAGAGRVPTRVELVREQEEVSTLYTAQTDASGRFAFEHVVAGEYVLRSSGGPTLPARPPSDMPLLWARAAVDVGERDIDIQVDLHPPIRVSGRVQFDGASPLPRSVGVTFSRDNDPGSDVVLPAVPVGTDGRFTVDATPGRYIVAATIRADPEAASRDGRAAQAWSLRSAMLVGQDVADQPLVATGAVTDLIVTFTDRQPVLRGVATARDGDVESALVLAFPADESLWVDFGTGRRLQAVRPARDGRFEFTRLPAGDYLTIAVEGLANDRDWKHPALLRELAGRARRVVLYEGQERVENLVVTAAPSVSIASSPAPVALAAVDRAVVRELLPSPPSGAVISGRVIDAGSRQPIGSARVTAGAPASGVWTFTDEQGRFTLSGLAAGRHLVQASKPPYVNAVYGAAGADDPGAPIDVADGEQVSGVTIAMTRGAAIGGTVVDEHGLPVADAQISVHAVRWQARGREVVSVRPSMPFPTFRTDVRGRYRVYGLAPGDYFVHAAPTAGVATAATLTTRADVEAALDPARRTPEARVRVQHAPVYYPNTIDPASAQPLRLVPGDDQTVDFQLQLVPLGRVSGTFRAAGGVPPERLLLRLTPREPLAAAAVRSLPTAGVDRTTGTFTFRDVPPGRYLVSTAGLPASPNRSTPGLSGSTEIVVNGDTAGVVVDLQPAGTVSGAIRAWPSMAGEWRGLRLTLSSLAPGPAAPGQRFLASIDADGQFAFVGVPPGRYRIESMLPGPPTPVRPRVASQIAAGVETIDAGLEVRPNARIEVQVALTTTEAQVSGVVRDANGRPAVGPFVVLFARDPQAWTPPSRRIFAVRPDQNGRYLFPDVPPGDYLIATLENVEPGAWFDPARLARLSAGSAALAVRADVELTVDLTVP